MRHFMALLVALLIASIIIPSELTRAADSCYPGSALPSPCLSGTFQQFWEQNGGLPVFGFPLTLAALATNPDTDQIYQTQWFERNRFELHPDIVVANRVAPGILLGRLGVERLQQLGRDWHSEPHAGGPQANCLWFPQTSHNVCDQGFPYNGQGFKSYWQTHGLQRPGLDAYARSLALFGLPLTEPAMETNSSGETVWTQWFERARFEWHPDKPDPFKVLLGRLGAELRSGSIALAPAPTITQPLPSSTPVAAPPQPTPGVGTAVSTAGCSQNAPAVKDGAQAWVTLPQPAQNMMEIVCGRLTTNKTPLTGVTTTFGVHYPALDAFTDAVTDSNGEAAVSFPTGPVTSSTVITVDVEFATGQHAQTSFTPQ
ncbi:MAG: hypothetical protein H0X37_12185 [Herpetosiphonaceae bacterium]|nr:hypothetical protein [Herpetosiphonaceae bacterium]